MSKLSDEEWWKQHEKEMETCHTPDIICPYCGFVDEDSWEVGDTSQFEEDSKTECRECDRMFNFSRNCEITYTTTEIKHKPDCAMNNPLPLPEPLPDCSCGAEDI
jgi:hypothetical protein